MTDEVLTFIIKALRTNLFNLVSMPWDAFVKKSEGKGGAAPVDSARVIFSILQTKEAEARSRGFDLSDEETFGPSLDSVFQEVIAEG